MPLCWCGSQWQGQVTGALAFDSFAIAHPIPQSDTTFTQCMTQIQHTMLNNGDAALGNILQTGALAQCELAALDILQEELDSTDCADHEPAVSFVGACWEPDPNVDCPAVGECQRYYDCNPDPVWQDPDETGGDEWGECPQ